MTDSCIYLDTYVLQQDMRVRMPKAILSNMGVEKGKTTFDIYLNAQENELIFRIHHDKEGEKADERAVKSHFVVFWGGRHGCRF